MTVRWGISSTILAPTPQILRFVAYHLEQGAHRLYIYLDAPTPEAFNHLKAHPKIRVRTCDSAYWNQRGGRPDKHQVRQSTNATHAYNRKPEVDWLIHMDVDEFLVPQLSVDDVLARLGDNTVAARVRPMELLGGSTDAFKAFLPSGPARADTVAQIYPTYGKHLRAGFLSHVAGKLFVRTGLPDMTIQIHNAFQDNAILQGSTELVQVDLAHCHAASWEDWHAAFKYRLEHGSYRAELKPALARDKGGLSVHELFQSIASEQGDAGLRAFYDEVVGDSPDLRARLEAHGLLRKVNLDLEALAAKHFPDASV